MIGRVSGCHCLKFISKVSYNESRGLGGWLAGRVGGETADAWREED